MSARSIYHTQHHDANMKDYNIQKLSNTTIATEVRKLIRWQSEPYMALG